MEPAKTGSIIPTSSGDKKDDREILADAIASVVSRINESFARLSKVEKQLNLHPRNVQDYPDTVKQYDVLFPTLSNLLNAAKQTKVKQIGHQVEAFVNAVIATRELVTLASSHRKPNESVLSPISNYVAEVIYTSTSNTSGLDASTVSILTSIASAAQALNWVTSSTPLSVVTDARTAFLKDKAGETGPSPTLDMIEKILTDTETYLENHHKSGIEWKGTKDVTALIWCTRGVQAGNLANGNKTKTANSDVWISEYLTKSQDYACPDGQELFVLYAHQATLSITGKASSITLTHVESVTLTNCSNLKVICPTAATVKVERSVGCHVGVSSATEVTTFVATQLQVSADEEPAVEVPTGIKVKVGKGGKVATSIVGE